MDIAMSPASRVEPMDFAGIALANLISREGHSIIKGEISEARKG